MRRESACCVSSSIPVTGQGKFLFFFWSQFKHSARVESCVRARGTEEKKKWRVKRPVGEGVRLHLLPRLSIRCEN